MSWTASIPAKAWRMPCNQPPFAKPSPPFVNKNTKLWPTRVVTLVFASRLLFTTACHFPNTVAYSVFLELQTPKAFLFVRFLLTLRLLRRGVVGVGGTGGIALLILHSCTQHLSVNACEHLRPAKVFVVFFEHQLGSLLVES